MAGKSAHWQHDLTCPDHLIVLILGVVMDQQYIIRRVSILMIAKIEVKKCETKYLALKIATGLRSR